MFLSCKQGVRVQGMSPEIMLAISVAHMVYVSQGNNCIITAVSDGKHMPGSLHYKGRAVDLRLPAMPNTVAHAQMIANQIRMGLTNEYDVILEKDHIHIEFDPKVPNELPPSKADA